MTLASTNAKQAPVLDEALFQRLLAAAFVVQQHNDNLRAKEARPETVRILAQIAEIQSLARTCSLDVAGVCAVVADRLRNLTNAQGVSIGLVTDGYLDCVAESGTPAKLPGSSLASHSLVATERLKSGDIFESDDAWNDIRLDMELCRELETGSLIAAPVHRFGELAGLVEVRWKLPKAFQQSDTRAVRLMAGLVTATLERSARRGPDNTAPAILPEVPVPPATEAAAATPGEQPDAKATPPPEPRILPPSESAPNAEDAPEHCRVCGHTFGSDEVFCGNCSMPRIAATSTDGLQSKWASMWYMQQAHDVQQQREMRTPRRTETRWLAPSPAEARASHPHPTAEVTRSLWTNPSGSEPAAAPTQEAGAHSISLDMDALEEYERQGVIRRMSQGIGMWRRHPIAVVSAFVAVFLMLSVWAFSPAPGNAQVTRFESLLVELGLAEVPSKPLVSAGRADAQVWVDVHTALYYCEGSDLYGKTPEGRFSSQREAQQDQFEPASRAPCK